MSIQAKRSNAQRANHLVADWDDALKPALDKIEEAARNLLHALDMVHTDLLFADDKAAVEDAACDVAHVTLLTLDKLVGRQRALVDDAQGVAGDIRLDVSMLAEEQALWDRRWAARRTPR